MSHSGQRIIFIAVRDVAYAPRTDMVLRGSVAYT